MFHQQLLIPEALYFRLPGCPLVEDVHASSAQRRHAPTNSLERLLGQLTSRDGHPLAAAAQWSLVLQRRLFSSRLLQARQAMEESVQKGHHGSFDYLEKSCPRLKNVSAHGRSTTTDHQRGLRNPRTGFGNIADTWQQARRLDPEITRDEVKAFLDTLRIREDRPQRGYNYNSFVPPEPMHQVQADLADMSVIAGKGQAPRYMLVAIDSFTKKTAAVPVKSKDAPAVARAWDEVLQKCLEQKLDFYDIDKQITRGHAYFAERVIRTLKEGVLRRLSAGLGRAGVHIYQTGNLPEVEK
ncbi:unnamed protein product [Symbiodinium sp. CCMP2456]|nr:unnamed protein product [Symbiodinium sp. CCMP2456]